MPSSLPTDFVNRKMNTFGVGTYDDPIDSEYREQGDFEARGESLPVVKDVRDNGYDMDSPDTGDKYTPVSDMGRTSSSGLPGDLDRPPKSKKKPEDGIIQTIVPSVAESLPCDKTNPPARSDYYDNTKIGESILPGPQKNENSLERFLSAIGNMWSGWELDDVAAPMSFPATDRPPEEVDKYTSVPIGASESNPQRFMKAGRSTMQLSTNLDLVGTLTAEFMKKVDVKDGLTRRHVMTFLQEGGYHQYLASDVIRCLQQRHNIHVADVLDQFPISKVASVDLRAWAIAALVGIRRQIAQASSSSANASALGECGNRMTESIAELVRGLKDD